MDSHCATGVIYTGDGKLVPKKGCILVVNGGEWPTSSLIDSPEAILASLIKKVGAKKEGTWHPRGGVLVVGIVDRA